jgi:hypothetical protein
LVLADTVVAEILIIDLVNAALMIDVPTIKKKSFDCRVLLLKRSFADKAISFGTDAVLQLLQSFMNLLDED